MRTNEKGSSGIKSKMQVFQHCCCTNTYDTQAVFSIVWVSVEADMLLAVKFLVMVSSLQVS